MKKHLSNEKGVSLVEILTSIILIGILGLGVTQSTSLSLKTTKHAEYNHIAASLAISKMEELAAINVDSLTAGNGGTETNVPWPNSNATFTRVTAVTVNADNSRTITVNVAVNNSNIPTSVEFSNNFALWE